MQLSNLLSIFYPKCFFKNEASVIIKELLFEDDANFHDPFCGRPFYRRSAMGERHGENFQLDEVFKVSPHFIKQVKKTKYCLLRMKSISYGVRLEVRFTANNWDALYCRTMELAKNQLPVHINWYKSHVLWSFVEARLDALVAIAKNVHDQADTRFTASQLTGVAFIAFMLSSLVHRPSDRSWWLPFADQLKAHRCRKSMALFVPSLFTLSKDNARWSCAVSAPSLQPMANTATSLNFDLSLYAEYINLLDKENYYWKRAVLYVSHYGLTDASVEPFVNLLMHELLFKFSKWDKYCKDQKSYQILQAYGSNFFCDKKYLKEILKNDHYNVAKTTFTKKQVQNLLLPSVSDIISNPEAVAFQHPLSPWKLIHICINYE